MKKYINGLALSIVISISAITLANFLPVGAVAIAIILGIIVGNTYNLSKDYDKGIDFAQKSLLGFAIALMGIKLDFTILGSLGMRTILIIMLGMIVTITVAMVLGRYMGIDKRLALLLGIGNGVCGSSAISATAPIIKADKESIGISIAIVNLLGTLGIFLLPAIATALGLGDIDAGVLIGNTLQAVGQVTAAGFGIDDTTGVSATTVKMGRVLLLTPLVFILISIFHNRAIQAEGKAKATIPTFIIFFVLFSIVGSLGWVNIPIKQAIGELSHYSLLIAMSAIGLKIHFGSIKSSGKRALQLASIVFVTQILFTILMLNL